MGIDLTRFAVRYGRHLQPPHELAPPPLGTTIGFTEEGKPVIVPYPSRQQGASILATGMTGQGKSSLVLYLTLEEHFGLRRTLPPARWPSLMYVDPQADFEVALGAVASRGVRHFRGVTYLSPLDRGMPLGLAALYQRSPFPEVFCLALAQIISRVSLGSGRAEHQVGPRQLDVLMNVIGAACSVPGGNIGLAADACARGIGGLRALGEICAAEKPRFYCQSARPSPDLLESCGARLRMAFATPAVEASVNSPTALSLGEILRRPGQLLFAQLAPKGGSPFDRQTWASLLVLIICSEIMATPGGFEGPHLRVVIDELPLVVPVIGQELQMVLTTGRTRGISLIGLSQGLEPISAVDPVFAQSLLSNTRQLTARLNPKDAAQYALQSVPTQGVEEDLRKHRDQLAGALCNLSGQWLFSEPGRQVFFTPERTPYDVWAAAAERHAAEIDDVREHFALDRPFPRRPTLDDFIAPPSARGRQRTIRRSAASPVSPEEQPDRSTLEDGTTSAPSPQGTGTPTRPVPRSRWG